MIAILSPSKNLNDTPKVVTEKYSIPEFMDEAEELAGILKGFSPVGLQELMKINPKLARLNVERFLRWNTPFKPQNSHPAVLTFKGEVYHGLKADKMKAEDLHFAQDHLRILSGLYGLLRPLDLIRPYRLEMGTSLQTGRGDSLYSFWGDKISRALSRALDEHEDRIILNLASQEYFKALDPSLLNARIINCRFKEERNGEFKFITIYGKKARGMMAGFMIRNRIENADDLKTFDEGGYYFNRGLSSADNWVFTR